MSLIRQEVYRFDDFEMQPSRRALLRRGEKIAIAPKTFEVLHCLVQNAGRVVLKDELLKAVWPDSFVEESNLTQHIFWLRKALGDGARYVVTIPGRGYEFTGRVAAVPEAGLAAPWAAQLEANGSAGLRIQQSTEVTHIVLDETTAVVAPRLPGAPARRWGTVFAAAGVVAMLASCGTWGAWWWQHRALPGDHHEVVLADFTNMTGDAGFDPALQTLLAIDLGESPFLVVASDNDTQTVLKLMSQPPRSPLTQGVALEVCERMNDQVVLAGMIANVGGKYLVTLTATDCQTGKALVQSKSVAKRRQDVIRAVDAVAAEMRKRLGETLKSHSGTGPRLQVAPTSSLDALRAYSQARELCSTGKRQDAIALYQHALELDPKFAVAYLDLGYCYRAVREYALGAASITKAYELRNRVDDALRLRIEAGYEDSVTGDLHAELRIASEWTELYPNQALAWVELADMENDLAHPELAIEPARRALALAPESISSYTVLAYALRDSGHIEEAKAVAREAIQRKLDSPGVHNLLFTAALFQHDNAVMAEQLAWLKNTDEGPMDLDYELFTEGKAHAAVAQWLGNIEHGRKAGLNEMADRRLRILMHREADYAMHKELKEQLLTVDSNKYPLNLVYANSELGRIVAAQEAVRAFAATVGSDTTDREIFLPEAKAAVALAQHRPEEAIAALEISRPYQGYSLETDLLRGQAYLAARNPQGGEGEFRRIIEHAYYAPEAPSQPLAHLGLARALAMEDKRAESRKEYETLFAIWKDADDDLKPLMQAREEYAKLR